MSNLWDFSRFHWGYGYTTNGNAITVSAGGTLNATWFGLDGDTVTLGQPSANNFYGPAETLNTYGYTPIGAVNVSNGATATINVNGYAVIGDINVAPLPKAVNINITPFSALNTHFSGIGYGGQLNVSGGACSWLLNNGASDVWNAHINADVLGTGSWNVETHSNGGGTIQFAQYVSPNQTINTAANGYMQIDQPHAFQGLINSAMLVEGKILLEGIQADHWTYQNDMLNIYDNGYLMDQLHIHNAQPGAAFTVENTSKGVALVSAMSQATHGTVPHMAVQTT